MGGKVLIVDDVATNRIVMKVKLTAAGYLPELAGDGKTCLAMAKASPPDLILLDCMLPDMPGADVLRRLRADPVTRTIPIVVFSASQATDCRVEAFRAGADDFLVKPLDDQTLMARIRSLVRANETLSALGSDLASDFGGTVSRLPAFGLAEMPGLYQAPGPVALILPQPEAT